MVGVDILPADDLEGVASKFGRGISDNSSSVTSDSVSSPSHLIKMALSLSTAWIVPTLLLLMLLTVCKTET